MNNIHVKETENRSSMYNILCVQTKHYKSSVYKCISGVCIRRPDDLADMYAAAPFLTFFTLVIRSVNAVFYAVR